MRADPVVEGVNKADFGTSFIYWKKNFKPKRFNSWAHSHLGRAMVALYQGTGERRVLDALVKVYADYPLDNESTHFLNVSGLCNLDAMLETYSYTADRRILDRALAVMAQSPMAETVPAWSEGRLEPNHMVILHENIRLPALVYPWSGDRRHFQATLGALKWIDDHHMLPYGVASGEKNASGIGAFRKTETCEVTAMLAKPEDGPSDFTDRLLLIAIHDRHEHGMHLLAADLCQRSNDTRAD